MSNSRKPTTSETRDDRSKIQPSKFYGLLRKRRNVYHFLSTPIPDDILARILENAMHVPSAGFTQDFDFIIIRNEGVRRKLGEAAHQGEYGRLLRIPADFISRAPVIVIPCANKTRYEAKYGKPAEEHSRLPWWLIDAAFASFALILSSFEEGLAASFIGALDDTNVTKALRLPEDGSVIPLAVIPMGYKEPSERPIWKAHAERFPKGLQRRRLGEAVHWEKW